MGRGHIWKGDTHGKETTRGGDYMRRRLHGEVITQGRDDMGERTTRGGKYTGKRLHGEGGLCKRFGINKTLPQKGFELSSRQK